MINLRPMDGILLIAALLIAWTMYRAHIGSAQFNLFDILMENGRVSKWNCIIMGAFVITSWQMVRLTLDGKITEGFFAAYGGIWIAPLIAKMFSPAPLPSTQTTTEVKQTTTEVKS